MDMLTIVIFKSHSGANLAEAFHAILKEFGIEHKVRATI